MRPLGALLVLAGAAGVFLLWLRESRERLRLSRALLEDLAVLEHQICRRRAPLPEILARELRDGPGAARLWGPLAEGLRDGAGAERRWAEAVSALPEPLDRYLAPLGPFLSEGGPAFAAASEEAREEIAGDLRDREARQALEGRLAAALCLSGAGLTILALL